MIDLFRKGPFRQALAFTLAVSVTSLVAVGLIYWQIATNLQMRRESVVAGETATILKQSQSKVRDQLQSWLSDGLLLYSVAGLFSPEGTPIAGNLTAVPPGLVLDGTVRAMRLPKDITVAQPATDRPEDVLIAGQRRPDGTVLVLGRTLSEVSSLRHQVADLTLLSVAVLFLGALLFTVRASGRQAEQVSLVRLSFARVMDGNLHERLPLRQKGDDLDRLARDVNRMLDRLQALVFEAKDVGDNIAHDLRTPLSVMRARLERAVAMQADLPSLRTVAVNSIADLDRALGSITALLRLAEIENGRRRASFRPTDLALICEDAFELYQPIAEEAAIQLSLEIPARMTMTGDPDLLVEAVTNLLDNAIKFTPANGFVTLSGWCEQGAMVIAVSDTGPGFPEAERREIGKRFYRADRSRHQPGTGLGLSLVRAIAELHGFVLSVSDNRPSGSVFALSRLVEAEGEG